MTRMPPKNGYQPPAEPPEYIRRWVGRRVEWIDERKGPMGKRQGIVINAAPVRVDGRVSYINLHIASDDGFLVYVSDSNVIDSEPTRVSEGHQ